MSMKRGYTALLQAALVLVGLGALAFLLWEPRVEGRNAHAALFEIYFKDPFLAYAYLSSVPFFIGLRQAFKALGCASRDETQAAAKALRTIRRCALALIGFVAVSVIFIPFGDKDDRPAGVFMRILVVLPSAIVAAAAARFERRMRAQAGAVSER